MRTHLVFRSATVAALALLASCNEAPTSLERGEISFIIVSGDGQSGKVGTELAQPIKVKATDTGGSPVPGVVVNFVVTSGGGRVYAGSALTDGGGFAADVWQMGTATGPAALEVRAVDASGVKHVYGTFGATATADVPVSITIVAGDGQTAASGTAVPIAPKVKLLDQYGNRVPGQTVSFVPGAGSGSVTGGSPLSDAQGEAQVGSWILGPAGPQTLTATATALPGSPVGFTATATGGASPQLGFFVTPATTASSGIALAPQPTVQLLTSGGTPINQAGVQVSVVLGGGGATLNGGAPVSTDGNGRAAFTSLSATGLVGNYTLTFSAAGYTNVVSNLALTAGTAATMVISAGDVQTVNAGSAVPIAPAVLVRDASGNPVQGLSITYAIASGGGLLTGATPGSDAQGIAQLGSWTLGLVSGVQGLTATGSGPLSGTTLNFGATALGNVWVSRAPMPTGRKYPAFAVINGLLYVAGGKDATGAVKRTLEVYNPATNTWTTKALMKTARVGPMYGVFNGILYVAGGNNGSSDPIPSVESYNPATNTWTTLAAMPSPRGFAASAFVNGIWYIGGGEGPGALATTIAYDPVTNSWSSRASLPAGRTDLTGTELNGLLYAVGGAPVGAVDGALFYYDPVANIWTQGPFMPTIMFHVCPVSYNGKVLVPGGRTTNGGLGVPATGFQVYDPVTNNWSTLASLPVGKSGPGLGIINNVMYLAGGDTSGGPVATTEAYVP